MYSKYFIEYEFESKSGKIYWFPLFINESDRERAYKIAKSINIALSERFRILRNPELSLVIPELNSELYNEYVNKNLKGILATLDIFYWKLIDIEPQEDLSFDQHLLLVDDDPKKFAKKTIAEGNRIKFPVKMIRKGISDHDEFLVINVVKPK